MSVHGLLSYLKERNAYKRINLIEKAKKKSLILVVDGDAFIHTLKGRYQVSKTIKEIFFYFCF
jgi:hypothetical protein